MRGVRRVNLEMGGWEDTAKREREREREES